jgi:Glycosyl transferase family 11
MNTNAIFAEKWGRLGNQMFEVGLLFSLNQRFGYDFYLPHNGETLWDCFDLDIPADGPECVNRFDEVNGSCNFDPGVFEMPDGTAYHGFFQSYRYLEGCEASLRRFLRFRHIYRARAEAILFTYRRRHQRPLVSLHVRRGDYVSTGFDDRWGNLASDGYYERAVEAIGNDVSYLVFSDDLPWCRKFFDLERVEFVDVDHCTSLCLMARCDVNVIANSTYSWWGAYLNPTGEIYAPKPWFGPNMTPPNDRQDDIVPSGWRTIPAFVGKGGSQRLTGDVSDSVF